MRGQRMWYTLRLFTILSAGKRTQYFKEKKIFHSMGNHCSIQDRVVPLYAKLISLGDNVNIASNVHFITHDVTDSMLNNVDKFLLKRGGIKYPEKVGCISIGDNVFIGAGTRIMYNVRIGSNVIIGANSLINKDVPDNCVVAGVPARVIKKLDEYLDKRVLEEAVRGIGCEAVTPEAEEYMWNRFWKERK